jgi:hypothetical protein
MSVSLFQSMGPSSYAPGSSLPEAVLE